MYNVHGRRDKMWVRRWMNKRNARVSEVNTKWKEYCIAFFYYQVLFSTIICPLFSPFLFLYLSFLWFSFFQEENYLEHFFLLKNLVYNIMEEGEEQVSEGIGKKERYLFFLLTGKKRYLCEFEAGIRVCFPVIYLPNFFYSSLAQQKKSNSKFCHETGTCVLYCA